MSLRWDRTEFEGGYRKAVFVVPNGASGLAAELALKYSGDNVFIATSASAQVAFHSALGQVTSGANDVIWVYPGTYTLSATITVNKNVTIRGMGENPNAVIIDADTSAVTAFTLDTSADYAKIMNLTITTDATNDAVIVGTIAPGVTVDGVTFNATDATTTVGIDAESDFLTVRNCKFYGFNKPIQSLGTKCLFVNDYIQTATTGAVGIDMQDGDWHEVNGCTFNISAGTSTVCIKAGTTSTVNNAVVSGCKFHATATTNVLLVNTSTVQVMRDSVISTTPTGTDGTVAAFVATF